MGSLPQNEEAIFQAARAIEDREARGRFLEQACAADNALRERVDGLLAEHENLGSFLEVSPAAIGTIERPATQRVGMRIGRYKLMEQIGEGGMGTVWVAEQTEPVKRRVALKLIKPGMDSRQVLSRFEAERQALALMDHPNIAKVFDGGMTDEGRPYFVMEYVKGMPITEYCDNVRLSIHQRLKLFAQVCQAVQHAHHKGVIHRDLKPSNILICLYDGQPVPKVIDFGLAKAMHQPLTENTLYTAHGLMVGTPLYMSPEQAELNNLDVDTRTDVYSLGVILYELLTGATPLEKQVFKDAAFAEILRLIKEVEPQRPSLKISSSMSLPSIAAQRNLEPAQLSRAVRGDLDWIVMKSLEKERSRRYETATGLARDIERYLDNQPIHARPPSTGYRVRKLIQRNKAAALASFVIAASLLLGTTISTWQAIRATAAENQAQANLEIVKEVAREWATSETLSGDPARAEKAIQVAEAAKVSRAWTEILRAQSEIDQGLYESPLRRLAPINDQGYSGGDDDSRLAALALRSRAHFLNGSVFETSKLVDDIKKLSVEPGPEAGLFKAIAHAWGEPGIALAEIDAASRKRPYPTGLLIRANALAALARKNNDYELITQALNELKYAELFAGDSGSVFVTKFHIHLFGLLIAQRQKKKEEAKSHRTQLRTLATESKKLPRSPYHALLFASAAYQLGQSKQVLEFAQEVDWRDSLLISFMGAVIHRLPREPSLRLKEFEKLKFDADNPYAIASQAHLLADIPIRRKELPDLYERIIKTHQDCLPARQFALQILALMGDSKKLQQEAKVVCQLSAQAVPNWMDEASLRFLAGEWDEERALEGADVFQQCAIHYSIGIHHLAAGDRARAKKHFELCTQTHQDQISVFQWAASYRIRMAANPNWPDWIEAKQ